MPLPTCEPVHMRSIRRIRLALLRVRRERPCYCRAAEERDERHGPIEIKQVTSLPSASNFCAKSRRVFVGWLLWPMPIIPAE